MDKIRNRPSLGVNKIGKWEWLVENLWGQYRDYRDAYGCTPPIPWCELEGKTYEAWMDSRNGFRGEES